MNELAPELHAIGIDLQRAYAGRLRRRRIGRVTAATAGLAGVLAVSALASTGDLPLDPAKWFVVSAGSIDNGRGEYVHAKSLDDGGPSTFMVEHDSGMDRYQAFLLHERLRAAADETSPVEVQSEPGALCTRQQLARAEQTALDALRAGSPAQTAVETAFAGEPCRGLAYGVEIARRVFNGVEPEANLMPGVA
jgi:hypothetical protein